VLQLRGGIQSYLAQCASAAAAAAERESNVQSPAAPQLSVVEGDHVDGKQEGKGEARERGASGGDEKESQVRLDRVLGQRNGMWEGVCFVFDERTAVKGQGGRVSCAEAEGECSHRCPAVNGQRDKGLGGVS
jgi:hypothetical protein